LYFGGLSSGIIQMGLEIPLIKGQSFKEEVEQIPRVFNEMRV
jgi:hypothetical protein